MAQQQENIIGNIIQAYLAGAQFRNKQEEQLREQQNIDTQVKLREQAQKEEERQAKARETQAQQELERRKDELKNQHEYQKQLLGFQTAQRKLDLMKALSPGEGTLQFPTIAANYAQENAPRVRQPYTEQIGDQSITIDPSVVPTQEQYINRLEEEAKAKRDPITAEVMARLASQQLIAGDRDKTLGQGNMMDFIAAMDRNNKMLLSAGMRGSSGNADDIFRGAKSANDRATNFTRSDSYKYYMRTNVAYKNLQDLFSNPEYKNLPAGIKHLAAMYMVNKAWDPNSTVREGEIANVAKLSKSDVEAIKYRFEGVTGLRSLASPNAITGLIGAIKSLRQVRQTELKDEHDRVREMIKSESPNFDDARLDKILGTKQLFPEPIKTKSGFTVER